MLPVNICVKQIEVVNNFFSSFSPHSYILAGIIMLNTFRMHRSYRIEKTTRLTGKGVYVITNIDT